MTTKSLGPLFKIVDGKIVKNDNKKKSVSQRIRERTSKKIKVVSKVQRP